MNVAPHKAEQWVKHLQRFLLSDTEDFTSNWITLAPVAILLNLSGNNNVRMPTFGCELRVEIDRNAVGNGTFALLPSGVQDPFMAPSWTLGSSLWRFTGVNSARKTNGDAATLALATAAPIITLASYSVTFTLSNRISGSIAARVGGTAGTSRSTNATFTETIVAGAGTGFDFLPSSDFAGDISAVTVYPSTAPGTTSVALYTCPDAIAALRSTEAFSTITLP